MGDKKGINIFKGTFFDFSIILAFYCQFCDFESVSKAFCDDDEATCGVQNLNNWDHTAVFSVTCAAESIDYVER